MAFPQPVRIGQFWQGLSNQSPWDQFPGQCKDILNMSLPVSVGAKTRSGTRLVGAILDALLDFDLTVDDMRFYHFRGTLLIFGSNPAGGAGFIKAFDSETLTERAVTGSFSYLDDAFKDTIRLDAIRDAVLVLNREVVPEAIASADYTVEGTVTTANDLPPAAAAGDQYYVATSNGFAPRGFYQADVVSPRTQDWTRISAPLQDDARLDGATMPHQLLQQFDDDFTFTITLGGPFVVGETITGAPSGATGTVRTVGPGDRLTAERTSVALFTVADAITGGTSLAEADVDTYFPNSVVSFVFSEIVWEERLSGTPSSNPAPVWATKVSGDGAPLDAMAFYNGRLFLIGANAVVFSDSRDRVQFFLDDVTDEIPLFVSTGSVDINAPALGEIQWALPATNNLVIIGENGQVSFSSGQEALSALNGVVNPIESFNNSRAIPVSHGGQVTMVDAFGDVRDFQFNPTSLFMSYSGSRNSHALRILQDMEVFEIFAFDDYTFFVGDDDTRLHQYTTANGQLVQNGWSKLRFPGVPVFMWQWEDQIYILSRDEDRLAYVIRTYIQQEEPYPTGLCFAPSLDSMISFTADGYDPDTDETEFIYDFAGDNTRAVKRDTLNPCANEWWDIPDPVASALVDVLELRVADALPYLLEENDVVDAFDDPSNQNIISSKGTYDGGSNVYLVEKFYGPNLLTDDSKLQVSTGAGKDDVNDGNTATFWQATGGDSQPTITYDFGTIGNEKTIIRYRISSTDADKPVSWTLEASNNGISWAVIDTRAAQVFADFETKEFDITNILPFRFYRLFNFEDTFGDGAQLSEWLAFELDSNELDLESDPLPATLTPTGNILTLQYSGDAALESELRAYASRNGGTDFVEVDLEFVEETLTGSTVVQGKLFWDDDEFGVSVKWKVTVSGGLSLNDFALQGVAMQWFDIRNGQGNQILSPTRVEVDRFFVAGDQRGDYIIGEAFPWFMLMTELYPQGPTNKLPIISVLTFFYVNSVEFEVGVKRKGLLSPPAIQKFSTANVGSEVVTENIIKTGSGAVHVGLDGRGCDIVFRGTGPVPTTLSAIEYLVRVSGKALGYGAQSESFGT